MRTVTVEIRADDEIGTTDRRLFGAFIEHVGRCVYGGIFEPAHDLCNSVGLTDIREKLIAKPLPFTRTPHEAGNIDERHGRWHDAL